MATASKPTLCGCLRNAKAIAEAAGRIGGRIAVIGGRTVADDSLRPCFEDWIGAGAIIEHLPGERSPEAEAAVAAWQSARPKLREQLRACPSVRNSSSAGSRDVDLAGEVNVSSCVPILREGAYIGA